MPQTPVKKLKIPPDDCFFAQIYTIQAEWSNNQYAKHFLSFADVANHAKFVFSWSAWVVYGFAIATKGSEPHSHQQWCTQKISEGGQSFVTIVWRHKSTLGEVPKARPL